MKNKKDILFVFPPTGWDKKAMNIAENDAPPLGMLYVASAARSEGLDIAVLDMNHPRMDYSGFASYLSEMNPRLVAFSVLTTCASQVKRLTKIIKESFPGIIVIAGGIHPTVLPYDMLSSGVDFALLGEGETTMVELAKCIFNDKSFDDIPGLAFFDSSITHTNNRTIPKQNSGIIQTSPRALHFDLDILQYPARDLVPILDYGQSGAICSSRGCPHTCSFCSSVLSSGHRYRKRSIDMVVDEIDQMHNILGIEHFQFVDDNFTVEPDRAMSLATLLGQRKYIWSCQTSVMELSDRFDVLTCMFEAGCREIYFGLESGSSRILDNYKGIDIERAITVIEHSASLHNGISQSPFNRLQTVVGFIIGHPEDDEQSIEETIQLALRLRRMRVDTMLSILQPYPGSAIFRHPDQYGVTIENNNYENYLYPKANISTKYLSRERINSLYASGLLRIMRTYRAGDDYE